MRPVSSGTQPSCGSAHQLQITPPQIVGPFYPMAECPDLAGDLTRRGGCANQARGQLLYVRGRVFTCAGEPVAGARVEIWQANAGGKYRHPSDTNPAPLDPNFKGFARITTDAAGRYEFRTIKPGRYATAEGEIRPPHIHFAIEGRFDRLVTQLYFAGEPENQTDRWLNSVPQPERLIVALQPSPPHLETHARVVLFNIVLPSG
jgi:protocatechuate 3,4-dioxygenase beta subunit